MKNENNSKEFYTKEQSKVISAFFTRQVVLFICAVIFLLAGMIVVFSKDFLSLKSTEPHFFAILVIAIFLIGLTCTVLSVVNYRQMQSYVKKADEINAKKTR